MSKKNKKNKSLTWSEMGTLTKVSFKEFFQGDSFTHGAALAYYAVFTLIPIIYLAISFFGLIVGQDRVIEIFGDLLQNYMGIADISGLTHYMYESGIGGGGSPIVRIYSIIVLVFISTAMFNSLRKSLNVFYGLEKIKMKPGNFILDQLVQRSLHFGLMAVFASAVIIIYFAQTFLLSVGSDVFINGAMIQGALLSLLEHLSIFLTDFIGFAIVFKFFNDGVVKWKLALTGALFTSILMFIGQILINYYLKNVFYASHSGIAGILLVVLVWIFYTSQIIFLGANYTNVYARMTGQPILHK